MAAVPYETAGLEDLAETVRLVEAAGGEFLAEHVDVRDPAPLDRAVAITTDRFGPVDILYATAGVLAFGPLAEADRDVWEVNLDVNLTGIYNSIRAVLPTMLERESGRIIATSSAGGRIAYANLSAYYAAKWGATQSRWCRRAGGSGGLQHRPTTDRPARHAALPPPVTELNWGFVV